MQTPEGGEAAIDPLELYASGIDTSDYVARVAPLIRQVLPSRGHLLDIGAGGGQLGASLRMSGAEWTAVEPSPTMLARLGRLPTPPQVIPVEWTEARLPARGFDTVLAANMPAPLTSACEFLTRCRAWTRRSIVWVVPAQNGPRGLCLAGCLPREWHGEDETPGVDIVLGQLPAADHPEVVLKSSWCFSLHVRSVPAIATYLAGRLGWDGEDPRRPALVAHLSAVAEAADNGFRLTVPRESAILVWGAR